MLFTYLCGTEEDTVASQSMLAISYIKAWHTVFQRRTQEKMIEITILVCIAIQGAVQLRTTNAASMKAQWARAGPALHTHRFCAAHACGEKRRIILLNACAGGLFRRCVSYMHRRSASTVNKPVNKQLPRVIAHLAVFILFYRQIIKVRGATGFTQPAHAQLVLL